MRAARGAVGRAVRGAEHEQGSRHAAWHEIQGGEHAPAPDNRPSHTFGSALSLSIGSTASQRCRPRLILCSECADGRTSGPRGAKF